MKLFFRFMLCSFFLSLQAAVFSQGNKTDCMDCHNDNTLTMDRHGKTISLFVDQQKFSKSQHGGLECTDCHADFNPDELPHKAGENISRVDCSTCHEMKALSNSVHNPKTADCHGCHSKHEIQPVSQLLKRLSETCISCHSSKKITSYKQSKHFQALQAGTKGATCLDCHNKSGHKVANAVRTKAAEDILCSTCHKNSMTEFSRSVHRLTKAGNTPGCVSCHGSHDINNNKYSISSQACLKCHLDSRNFPYSLRTALVSFVENFKTSIHAKKGKGGKEAAACVDCHGNHMITKAENSKALTARDNIPYTCGKCHPAELADYKRSSHGQAFNAQVKVAPICTDCHGEHEINAIYDSPLKKINEKEVCNKCHVDNPEVLKHLGTKSDDIFKYERSSHYLAIKRGNDGAASCSDCHSAHLMLPSSDNSSGISRNNIAATCGTGSTCHGSVVSQFEESVHGRALKKGNPDVPTCVKCHGNHQITSAENNKMVVTLCSSCHDNVELNKKWGLNPNQADSYSDSYHGLAIRGGSKYAANCASCHGIHNIKPSSDSTSTIHPKNLSGTCGKCHPGAELKDEFQKVHLSGSKEESPLLYWISYFYLILIAIIIGAMTIHNILDLIRKLIERKAKKKKESKKHGKEYLRMTVNERIQHFIMLTSFISLAISGFGLKYPEAFWVDWIRSIMGDNAFELRGLAHRIFGIAMIAISLYHLGYVLFTRRGRQLIIDFLPTLQDGKDAIVNIKYLLGLSKIKPLFGRFSYIEKAEYWALLWGVIVMSVTGLLLMFNTFFMSIAPKIFFDIATIIHFFEAWLATLAIFVWHFYFVIFSPGTFPLNKAFITGTLTEEQMEHEHPLELRKMVIENNIEESEHEENT